MKLSVTEYEREQLVMAQQVVDELNAGLAGRGAEFRFAVTLANSHFLIDPDGCPLTAHHVCDESRA